MTKEMQEALPKSLDVPNFELDTGIHAAIDSTVSMLDISAKVDALTSITTEMFPALLKAMDIKLVLDDGTLVGKLAPQIDKNLAILKRRSIAF